MNKTQLETLFIALSDALEREVTELPRTKKDLSLACEKMKKRLLRVPNGEEMLENILKEKNHGL